MVTFIDAKLNNLPDRFLQIISEELKSQSGYNLREEVFFPLRYDRNQPQTVQHKYIAQKFMPKDSRLGDGYYWGSIGTTSQNVVRSLAEQYTGEMEGDGVDLDTLLKGERGKRGTWTIAYDWLWNCKYPRWLNDYYWQYLKDKVNTDSNWIEFREISKPVSPDYLVSKGMVKGPDLNSPPPVIKPASLIPKNQQLSMEIKLEERDRQLLLFNSSAEGKVVICPSFGYGLHTRINGVLVQLPQDDAWARQSDQDFKFKKKGIEEFLAVVLPTPLDMENFLPEPEEEVIPELTNHRFELIFAELEKQQDWHIFHQTFQVRSQKNKSHKKSKSD